MNNRNNSRRAQPRRNALVIALAVGLGFTGFAYGQATTGTIFGTAPSAAGQTVKVSGTSGVTRTVSVAANGRYAVSNLPVGTYTVTLNSNGSAVSTRNNVGISVGGGTEVDFAAANANAQNATELQGVNVSANALPSIDVTAVNNTTVITAADLQKLPVGRNAESIALLSPGTVSGSAFFGNAVSFGGSSVAENAYYVNGYNTGEPYRNIGGFQLPYGSIAQQQTLTSGFGAKYGRSDGGVISQIGKRGTNEWHFGGQITWTPRYLRASPGNIYNPVQPLPAGTFACRNPTSPTCIANGGVESYTHQANYKPGQLNQYRNDNKGWATVYDFYVGGPLIKDKLYAFASGEYTETRSTSVGTVGGGTVNYSGSHETDFYGKIDWNINDNNVLEGTFLQTRSASGKGATYNYDYATHADAGFNNANNSSGNNSKFYIAQYTGYLSDAATLSIIYGKGSFSNPTYYANKTNLPLVGGGPSQNPAYWVGRNVDPDNGINPHTQTVATKYANDANNSSRGLRIDFNYIVGDHNLGIGIDNNTIQSNLQSGFYTGGQAPAAVGANNPNNAPLNGTRWIYYTDLPDPYLVRYLNISTISSQSATQKAYYLQDNWQVTPNLLLNLGIRNDHYTNYNGDHVAFVDEKNQWEPRLGFSWDVFGDSSFRVFGNVGRYYLALPPNASNRAASASTYVQQYFHYTGIDDNGLPQGLSPAPELGSLGTEITSPDGEFGTSKDPRQVTASNLKPMYIDQYNLGFDKKLGENWQYGAKASYRDLGTTIDDECMPEVVAAKAASMGLDPNDYTNSLYISGSCRIINPGKTSNLVLLKDGTSADYVTVPVSFADWGYPSKPKRRVASLNVYFEHPFDGKWQGRIDYIYSYSNGNTSGQVRPDFGQSDVSKTEDWDSAALMLGQDGELLNNRKHTFLIRGAYQITPEWLVSTTGRIQSGQPRECLGYTGADALGDPTGYNGGSTGNYHSCAGQIVHPGSDSPYAGHQPWTYNINLGVRYMPAFADHKLAFGLNVFNILNEQRITQGQPSLVSGPHQVANAYNYPVSLETPRYVRLTVSYDY